jgi:hypothetical protein
VTNKRIYHVAPSKDRWEVKVEGAHRAAGLHDTKEQAVAAGRELARRQRPSELVVHKLDGSIQRQFMFEEEAGSREPGRANSVFGCMRGTARITGDIVGPSGEEWNAER